MKDNIKLKLLTIWHKCCNNEITGSYKESGDVRTFIQKGFVINGNYMIGITPSHHERMTWPKDVVYAISFGNKIKGHGGIGFICNAVHCALLSIDEYDMLHKSYTQSKINLEAYIDVICKS